VPVLHRLAKGDLLPVLTAEVVGVEPDVAMQAWFPVFARSEVVTFSTPSIRPFESLHHSVGLRVTSGGSGDAPISRLRTRRVELMRAVRGRFVQGRKAYH